MLLLHGFGLFDALYVHDALLGGDEVVQGSATVDSVRFLELFGVCEPIEEEEKLRVLLGRVHRARQFLHFLLQLAH